MELRRFSREDLEEILALFYQTIHQVNAADYSPAQLEAWAPAQPDRSRWTTLEENYALVAWEKGRIVGFGDLAADGLLDRLFVRFDCQGKGVGTALLQGLEAQAARQGNAGILTFASITARPFFQRHGYRELEALEAVRNGQRLLHYKMEKKLEI